MIILLLLVVVLLLFSIATQRNRKSLPRWFIPAALAFLAAVWFFTPAKHPYQYHPTSCSDRTGIEEQCSVRR